MLRNEKVSEKRPFFMLRIGAGWIAGEKMCNHRYVSQADSAYFDGQAEHNRSLMFVFRIIQGQSDANKSAKKNLRTTSATDLPALLYPSIPMTGTILPTILTSVV